MPNRPAVPVAAPARSSRASLPSYSTRTRGARAATSRPIGTLMKKVQRQSASVRTPPRMRPTAAPAPDIAAYTAIARLRSLPAGKVVLIRARAAGEASAAPAPWRTRATRRISWFGARPPRSEAAQKTMTPTVNIRRRPKRSPSRPPSMSRLPKARAYAVTTHCRPASEKPRSVWMWGRAMFTIVPSRTIMSWALAMTMSARRRPRDLGAASDRSRDGAGSTRVDMVVPLDEVSCPVLHAFWARMCRFWAWGTCLGQRCAEGTVGVYAAIVAGLVERDVHVPRGRAPLPGRVVWSARSVAQGRPAGREQDLVDDVADVSLVGADALDEDPVEVHGGQDRRERAKVGVGAELAAGLGPAEHEQQVVGLGPDEPVHEQVLELGVAVQGREGRGEDAGQLVEHRGARAEHRLEVAEETAGVGGLAVRAGRLVEEVLHGRHDQLGLALPLAVERGLAGPDVGGEGVEGEPVVADLDQQVDDAVEDLLLALALDAGAAGPVGGRGGHGFSSGSR